MANYWLAFFFFFDIQQYKMVYFQISAKAACSSIETHITYPQSVAFADTFGKVNVAAESMERGVTYRVELAMCVFLSKLVERNLLKKRLNLAENHPHKKT